MGDFNQDSKIVGGAKTQIANNNYNFVTSGTVVINNKTNIVGLVDDTNNDKIVLYKDSKKQNDYFINTINLTRTNMQNYSYINMDAISSLNVFTINTTITNVQYELVDIIKLLDHTYFIKDSPKRIVIDNLLKNIEKPKPTLLSSSPTQPASNLYADINTRITMENQPQNKVVVASDNNALVPSSQSTELVVLENFKTKVNDKLSTNDNLKKLKDANLNLELSYDKVPDKFYKHNTNYVFPIINETPIGEVTLKSGDMTIYQTELKNIITTSIENLPNICKEKTIKILNEYLYIGHDSTKSKKELENAIASCNDVDILAEITSDILNKVLKQTQEEKESASLRLSETKVELDKTLDTTLESVRGSISNLPPDDQYRTNSALTIFINSITDLEKPNANATTIAGIAGITDPAKIAIIDAAIANPDNNTIQDAVDLINATTIANLPSTLPANLKKQIQEGLNKNESTIVAGLMSISESAIALKNIEEIQKQINVKFTLILNNAEDTLYISDVDVLLTNFQGDIPAGSTTINKTTLKVGGTSNTDLVQYGTTIDSIVTDIIKPLTNNDAFNKIKRVYNTDTKTNAPTAIEGSVNKLTIEYDLFLKQDKLSMLFKPLNMKNDYWRGSTVSFINKQISKDVIKNRIVFKSEEPSDSMYDGLKTAYKDLEKPLTLKQRFGPSERKAAQAIRNNPNAPNKTLQNNINLVKNASGTITEIDGGRRRTKRRSSRKTKRRRNHKQKTQRRRKYRKTSR